MSDPVENDPRAKHNRDGADLQDGRDSGRCGRVGPGGGRTTGCGQRRARDEDQPEGGSHRRRPDQLHWPHIAPPALRTTTRRRRDDRHANATMPMANAMPSPYRPYSSGSLAGFTGLGAAARSCGMMSGTLGA